MEYFPVHLIRVFNNFTKKQPPENIRFKSYYNTGIFHDLHIREFDKMQLELKYDVILYLYNKLSHDSRIIASWMMIVWGCFFCIIILLLFFF